MTVEALPLTERRERPLWQPILLAWMLMVVINLGQMWPTLTGPGFGDPDVMMRLQQVRDFLGGQGWYDLTQYRLGVPQGVAMHWSRVVDLPLAGLILLASPFTDAAHAELFAVVAWPALLSLGFVAAVTLAALRLGGRGAVWPAALMALCAIHLRYTLSPGNIHHHNIQLVFTLAAFAAVIRLDRGALPGAITGLIGALMMAVGMETLPEVATIGSAVALAVTVAPQRFRRGAAAFGLAYAMAAGLGDLVFVAKPGPGTLVCDAFSRTYALLAVIAGGGVAALALLPHWARAPLWLRLLTMAGVGLAAVASVWMTGPACLAGPQSELDPRLVREWLDNIDEAQSYAGLVEDHPSFAIAIIGAPLVGLLTAGLMLWRAAKDEALPWCVALGLGLATIAVMLVEIRAAPFAIGVALPIGAALIAWARGRLGGRPGFAWQAALVAAYLLPQGITYEGIGRGLVRLGLIAPEIPTLKLDLEPGTAQPPDTACFDRRNFAAFAGLPPGNVLASANLGAPLIVATPHGAVAGNYHRDPSGILDSFDALKGSPATAHAIVLRRHITYVAYCLADSSMAGAVLGRPQSFSAALTKGPLPDWLEPVLTDGPIRVFRVKG